MRTYVLDTSVLLSDPATGPLTIVETEELEDGADETGGSYDAHGIGGRARVE